MAWEITTEELLKQYTSGKRNFAGTLVIREEDMGESSLTSKVSA